MKNRRTDPKSLKFDSLKKQAKEFLDKNPLAAKEISNHDVRNLIEDLQIHQIELEMQNEGLRLAQQELEALRDRYADLYDFAPVGYFTISEKGIFLEANLSGASMLGAERGSLIGKPFSGYVCGDDQDIFYLHRKRLSETGARQTCDLTLARKDGSQFHARLESTVGRDSEGNFNQFRVSASDISECRRAQDALQKAHDEMERRVEERTAELVDANRRLGLQIEECGLAEKALRDSREALVESEERLNKILTKLPDIVYLLDPAGAVSFVSHAVTKYGYSPENLIGVDILDLVYPEDKERVCYGVKERRTGERSTKSLEVRLLPGKPGREGVERTFLLSAEGLYAGNASAGRKDFLGTQGIARDISEHKEALAEKKRLEVQLRQAQKMEAVGTLAGGIAHDFNNLLMGIKGNVSLMLTEMNSSHSNHERLKIIDEQIQSGAKLTSHLLGFARKGRYEIKPIDLNQVLKNISDTFGRTRRNIVIHQQLAKDLMGVNADPVQVEQVILNLLVNAADAMPHGGNLVLRTMHATHEAIKGELYAPKPGNYVLLILSDTGTGIDPETREHIFEPFFTTKEMGHGAGLGLASVYGIIKGHGGYIEVHSEKGQGATFKIYLPATEKKVEKVAEREESFINGTGTVVLLVDDEEIVLAVSQEMLEAIGYRVMKARDGQEAIEVYRAHKDEIDIVVLDMVMPNGSGGETYDRMKQINPNVKVLLSSGYSIDGKAKEILDRGCNGFTQKPYSINQLSKKIREILSAKQAQLQ